MNCSPDDTGGNTQSLRPLSLGFTIAPLTRTNADSRRWLYLQHNLTSAVTQPYAATNVNGIIVCPGRVN